MELMNLAIVAAFAPLVGASLAGFLGWKLGRAFSHTVTIASVLVSLVASLMCFQQVIGGGAQLDRELYTWAAGEGFRMQVGFLVDPLTVTMMVVVTFVSLMVHLYTIGYMADDPGYQRFFAYISLFTFSMMMLVMANNFLQLFFGWEAVGLVSYLLIGFWFTRPTAIYANLKAFLVNRVGDFGFLLAIAVVFMIFGTLDYVTVFAEAKRFANTQLYLLPSFVGGETMIRHGASALTVICIGLFIGAMGKSAQFPLHVWLPDSMEGPTPISALIHAATMVTAGIFMVARMSPLFELSPTALSFVVVIGAITAFFMALVAIVQYDIKRVVAYSTLSQLGYMTMALGAAAYPVAIFHLMTHAFFKAVLFLGAGSVIIALHHEQDMRRMGGLRKYLPITYLTVLIGALANAGIPPFAGFFSKDSIIEALHLSNTAGAHFAYWLAVAGVFVGGFYSFRLVFFAFHGKERWREAPAHDDHAQDAHGHGHEVHEPHESPWVVTVPLVLLAIPSVIIGWIAIQPMLYGPYFGTAIAKSATMAKMAEEFHGAVAMMVHSLTSLPLWLALGGAALAYYLYIVRPDLPAVIKKKSGVLAVILEKKYGFDDFNDWFFAGGARRLGTLMWKWGDVKLIDGLMVNGTARLIGWGAAVARRVQTGYLYHYAFTMIFGVFVLLSLWFFWYRKF
ncbi:NADH-quinone oxidoreductase subunit L [Betaproteobacteria bacterium GR16-43]|nr:NADH-quinone oxidoreductase subunit L [Betaproteobacteria bacterium GR16-43]